MTAGGASVTLVAVHQEIFQVQEPDKETFT
jgi:hypothetical protein